MKKLLAIILAVGMLLCLVACQSDANTESDVSENSSALIENAEQSNVTQTTTTKKAEDTQTTSSSSSATQSNTTTTTTKAACSHKYSAASCTAAAK